MDDSIYIWDTGSGLDEIDALLTAEGLITERQVLAVNAVGGGGWETLFVAMKDGGPIVGIAYVAARVLFEYLRGKNDRRIVVRKEDGDMMTEVDATGYTAEELARVIKGSNAILLYDDNKKQKRK